MLLTQKPKTKVFRQFIHPIINSEIVSKLFTHQEWLTSSSWMGDGCAFSSPVIPHPSFHLHQHHHHHYCFPLGYFATVVALAASSLEKKIEKHKKKKSYCILCTLKCTICFVWKKNIIVFSDFSAFKIKVTALLNFKFFFFLYF